MTTHIVFGISAGTLIKHTLQNDNQHFIIFDDILSIGPIDGLHDDDGIERRWDWLRSNNMMEESSERCERFKQNIQKLNLLEDDEVVIWYADNAAERIGLWYVMSYLMNHKVTAINISEMIHRINHSNKTFDILYSGEVNMQQVQEIYALKREWLTSERKMSLIHDYKNIERGTLRVIVSAAVAAVSENYFDDEILETVRRLTVGEDSVLMTRVVGEMLGLMNDYVGDEFIKYRIFELVKMKKLTVCGENKDYRSRQMAGIKIKTS